ncbi:MAG TPA: CocE/NonD family hydrolase [Nocardioides sp.]|nr:CocE/NonD family hydrolase [Nocardioides sp.]
MVRRTLTIRGTLLALLCGLLLVAPPDRAGAADPVAVEHRFTASDGVELAATLTSQGPVQAKPTVVEFSPYGRGSQTLTVGPAYNYLLVQIRGTGDSDGRFDALGPASQRDVVEVLEWACAQPFSDGRLAVNGFSASAIVLYNSWHQELPCVEAAIMKSGTHELYRDLLVPGGIANLVPGAGVLALIGGVALAQGPDRIVRDPQSSTDILAGLFDSGLDAGLRHRSLDVWWQERGWRGDANDIPVLMINGFFDVESRGAFQAYRALEDDGAHLLMAGGHDGVPVGTDGGAAEAAAWLDHFVRGVDNGVETHPRVQLLMSNGDREEYLRGDLSRASGDSWPLPGTSWTPLTLDARRSGSARSLNDGSLSLTRPAAAVRQSYVSLPSIPTMTDVPNAAIVGAAGLNALFDLVPALSEMNVAEALGLTYTTPALQQDVVAAGPLSLELPLAATVPETGIWAVLSDVAPDGTSHPLTVGRLSTAYPNVVESRSLLDDDGEIVQPYGDYSVRSPAAFKERTYRVELWPVGNRFEVGHRIRLQIVGVSAASPLSLPAVSTIRVGGPTGARLLFPVLPGSDLAGALGG